MWPGLGSNRAGQLTSKVFGCMSPICYIDPEDDVRRSLRQYSFQKSFYCVDMDVLKVVQSDGFEVSFNF